MTAPSCNGYKNEEEEEGEEEETQEDDHAADKMVHDLSNACDFYEADKRGKQVVAPWPISTLAEQHGPSRMHGSPRNDSAARVSVALPTDS